MSQDLTIDLLQWAEYAAIAYGIGLSALQPAPLTVVFILMALYFRHHARALEQADLRRRLAACEARLAAHTQGVVS